MVAHQILPFIQRGPRSYTAHDINHCIRVIEYTNKIIEILDLNGASLSQTETRLLYLAGWLHDIGNLRCQDDSRERHSEESCKMLRDMIERDRLLIGSKGMGRFLEKIILYHQSRFDLSDLEDEEFRMNNDRVRVRLLCAVLRLADACHMGEDRASGLVYALIEDQLGPEAKAHWRANRAIMSVDFQPQKKSVTITVMSKKATEVLVRAFKKEFNSVVKYLGDYFPIVRVHVQVVKRIDRLAR
jgi:hypothetical protein